MNMESLLLKVAKKEDYSSELKLSYKTRGVAERSGVVTVRESLTCSFNLIGNLQFEFVSSYIL